MSGLISIVAVKQVPDTAEIRIDPATNSLMREGVPAIVNPEDRHAVEAALRLRDAHGGTVIAISMGPPQAREALEEVLAMGADRAILLSDRKFAGSDTLVTARTLARAITRIGKVDLIVTGRQAIDGDTAQVGPQIAGFLHLPQVTYAEDLCLEQDRLVVRRGLEDCVEQVRVRLPALVTVTAAGPLPRYPALTHVARACDPSSLEVWGAEDLDLPPDALGLAASPTGVQKIFEPERATDCEFISGDEKTMVRGLLARLKERQLL